MWRHGGDEIFDEVIGDEGVAQVEFGYVGLSMSFDIVSIFEYLWGLEENGR